MLLPLLVACAPAVSTPDTAACTPDPAVTWQGWGQGFFTTWCRSCHSATAADRRGAPTGVDFDTADEVWAQRDIVTARVLTAETMPVGGGLSADDRAMLATYLACPDTGAGTSTPLPTPPVTLSADDVATRIQTVFQAGLPRAETLWTAYLDLLDTHGQLDCPYGWQMAPHGYQSPMQGCVTAAGWTFAGLTERDETTDADGTWEWLAGDSFVEDPDGAFGTLAGEVTWWRAAGSGAWWQTFRGTWGWPWADGWLATIPSASLSLAGTWAGATLTATLDGGVSIDAASVYFDGVTVDTATCPTAPTGGDVRVRDDAGYWYTLALAADCSGCGALTDPDGGDLGQLCPDWAPVLAGLAEDPS